MENGKLPFMWLDLWERAATVSNGKVGLASVKLRGPAGGSRK